MNIHGTHRQLRAKNINPQTTSRNVESTPGTSVLKPDSFQAQNEDDCQRVYGSVGAMAGALTGRTAVSLGGAVLGGLAMGTLGLGVAAVGVGALVGFGLGVKGELASKIGRLTGGLLGGVVGSSLGWAADKFGIDTTDNLNKECKNFSVSSLPKKLLNTNYTSHQKLRGAIVEEGVSQAKPGDIIVTNNDGNFMLELMQKATGGAADWTHTFLVDENGGVIDILKEDNTPRRMPLATAFEENNHAMILRPNYKNDESIQKTIDHSRSLFGKITYDAKFDLKTKDAMYCQEYIYNSLQTGAPEISVEPRKALGIREVIAADEFSASPDIKETWSTGSNFWVNWLSHFN